MKLKNPREGLGRQALSYKPLLYIHPYLSWFFRLRLCHRFHLLFILYFVAVCTGCIRWPTRACIFLKKSLLSMSGLIYLIQFGNFRGQLNCQFPKITSGEVIEISRRIAISYTPDEKRWMNLIIKRDDCLFQTILPFGTRKSGSNWLNPFHSDCVLEGQDRFEDRVPHPMILESKKVLTAKQAKVRSSRARVRSNRMRWLSSLHDLSVKTLKFNLSMHTFNGHLSTAVALLVTENILIIYRVKGQTHSYLDS